MAKAELGILRMQLIIQIFGFLPFTAFNKPRQSPDCIALEYKTNIKRLSVSSPSSFYRSPKATGILQIKSKDFLKYGEDFSSPLCENDRRFYGCGRNLTALAERNAVLKQEVRRNV